MMDSLMPFAGAPASTRKSVPPEGFPQFSCMTLRLAAGGREASPERVIQTKEKHMTTETNNQPKKIPNFTVIEKGADGKNIHVGVIFNHGKGEGFNIVIGGKRYSAFPVKSKT
jgi:hypothetical protein